MDYGSVEITEERAVYSDATGVRWRMYDFAQEKGGKRVRVRVGSLSASMRIYVHQDGRYRRCALFSSRDDTLTPSFNHHHLTTAMVQRLGKWVHLSEIDRDKLPDRSRPHAEPRYH